MTNRNLGRWLLVALAIAVLVLAAPVVSAHGDEPTGGDETAADVGPTDGDAASWAAWMDGHMTDRVGPDARGGPHAMEPGVHSGPHTMEPGVHIGPHIGVTGDEMPRNVTDGGRAAAGTNRHGC